MFTTQVLDLDDVVILQCKGRLVRSEAAYSLRNLVQRNSSAGSIILDFSELEALEGGGLGMLEYLQQWAAEHGIRLTLLNPSPRVEERLRQLEQHGDCEFEYEREPSLLNLVGLPEREHWFASGSVAA